MGGNFDVLESERYVCKSFFNSFFPELQNSSLLLFELQLFILKTFFTAVYFRL